MKEIKSVVKDIQSAFDRNNYPDEFLAAYDQIECLANHYGRETFLVQEKSDEELFIAKCYDRAIFSLPIQADLLADLEHEGLPRLTGYYGNEDMICIVREYIEGTPLSEYAKNHSLSIEEVVDIGTKLCDILDYLHSRPQTIIHRDIKPSNIIVRPDGNIVLIDFDIARMFRDGASEDTVFFGTKGFAAPEQYGFSQSDARVDIYSFGVLLRYLLTGSIKENSNIILNPAIQAVIDRCTAFAPKDRFQNIAEVKTALYSARKRLLSSPKNLVRIALAALLVFLIGFVAGRYSRSLPPPDRGVSFSEPLVEAAVRQQLDVDEDHALETEDLRRVKQLFIFGTEACKDWEAFDKLDIYESVRGDLKSLEDIRKLPNLEEVCIGYQGELDISAFESAINLSSLRLRHIRVSDCSPLVGLKGLRHLSLFGTDISDFTALESCERLEELDVGLSPIRSVAQVGAYPWLRSISLKCLNMDDLSGIEHMPRLETVYLDFSEIDDVSALLELPYLQRVYAQENNFEQISETLLGSGIEVIILN